MSNNSLAIVISNELIRAAHGLTLIEKRLLMLAIAQLDSKLPPTPENLVSKIRVRELLKEFEIDERNAYTQAKAATERLLGRYIRFKNGAIESRMQWIGQANYHAEQGWIELEFWHKLAPHLFELKSHFTSYKLSHASGLRSVYSWRLFELLMQFKRTGALNILIDDFHHAMESPDSLRSNFANLRNRIIEPATAEIKERTGLVVEWETTKTGRKVKALKFTFPTEQQTKLPIDKPDNRTKTEQHLPQTPKPDSPKLDAKEALMSKQEVLSQFVGLQHLSKSSKQTIDALASQKELEAFKRYGLM